jgi:hypothetical protein
MAVGSWYGHRHPKDLLSLAGGAVSSAITRRRMLAGSGATAALMVLSSRNARALSIGDIFGGIGAALFPGVALGLSGFEIIKTLGNVNNLIGNVNDLVGQTQALESHIDTVITQIQGILTNVQTIVADCDQALKQVEALIAKLPAELATAFDEAAAKQAFADLQADTANMSSYLTSRASIQAESTRIQNLSEKIVRDISRIKSTQNNPILFAMQVIPALSTWVHGYTAYNMLKASGARDGNPWDHNVVKVIALPRINDLIGVVTQQRNVINNMASTVPSKNGSLYQFSGTQFAQTNLQFATSYASGQMSGNYYVIWPGGPIPSAQTLQIAPNLITPNMVNMRAGELCYLLQGPNTLPRIWSQVQHPDVLGMLSPENIAALNAEAAYMQISSEVLPQYVSFEQLTDGFGVFQKAVQDNLVTGDRDSWAKIPVMPA